MQCASDKAMFPHRTMAQEGGESLSEVRARVGASHGITDLGHKLHFYDRWAPDYDQVNWPRLLPLCFSCLPRLNFPICKVGLFNFASSQSDL